MTRDAANLYREVLLDHGHHPRGAGPLPAATHEATAHNPLCGDRITVRLRLEGDAVAEVRFEARGCLIAQASASLMTEALAGRRLDEALERANAVSALVSENEDVPPGELGPLEPLRAVREFPARKACVILAWDALRQALSRTH
jgi:nitrogen fixation NifU-like protein